MNKKLLTLATMAALVVGARYQAEAATVYNTEALFLTEITGAEYAPYYLNDFDTWSFGAHSSPAGFSGGGYSYTISAPGGLYGVAPGGNPAMSTADDDDVLTISIPAGTVTAVGGIFFLTDDPGNIIGGTVDILLSDSTSVSVPSASFRGFATESTSVFITSVTITDPTGVNDGQYASLDHFYVARQVSETASVPDGGLTAMLLGMSVLASGWFRRRVQ